VDALLQDLKFAARHLLEKPAFVVTAGLTLALCLGANTTIFSVIDAVILRPLPVQEPERLVRMWNAYPGATGGDDDWRGSNGAPDYYDRRALTDVFQDVASYTETSRSVALGRTPQMVRAFRVTPSFFRLLGVDAALGRTFVAEEGEVGRDRAVVLSHGLFEEQFAGDPSAIGGVLRIDGEPFTVVGVMPPGFSILEDGVRLWTALAYTAEQRSEYHSNSWQMLARLQPGVTLAEAQARVEVLNAQNMAASPELKPLLIDAGFHTVIRPLPEDLVRDVAGVLYLLWGAVGFVLLIGAVNVANLVLVRSTARARDLAVRFALGAPRLRVTRQLAAETVLLTLISGGAGILVARLGLGALSLFALDEVPRAAEIRLDATAVAFSLAVAALVGALIAIIPIVSVRRVNLTTVLRDEGRSGTASRRVRLLRKALVAAQVALAVVLMAGAGLLIASFRQVLAIDPGFDSRGVLSGSIRLPEASYQDDARIRSFVDRALGALAGLPGVTSVGTTSQVPFGRGFSDSVIFAEGYVRREGESVISPSRNVVSPDYFRTMGIALREGRVFNASDVEGSRDVIVIDEQLADRFWPGDTAIGKRMWQPTSVEDLDNPETAEYFDVVGVVESIRLRGLVGGTDDLGAYYFPAAQVPHRDIDVVLETVHDPAALSGEVRRAIGALDPELPIFDLLTMEDRIGASLTDRRTPMLLAAVFGVLAVLLAAVGIYGVLAYLVQLRTREIGIRMALGADRRSVFAMVQAEGLTICGIGLTAGLAGTVALRSVLEARLYGVSPVEPGVLLGVVAALGLVAIAASALPARRATRVDPVVTLAGE